MYSVSQTFDCVSLVFKSAFSTVWGVFEGFGATEIVSMIFFMFLSYRFFLRPILGGSGSSDKAKKNVPKNEKDS